jgi:MFS family permease
MAFTTLPGGHDCGICYRLPGNFRVADQERERSAISGLPIESLPAGSFPDDRQDTRQARWATASFFLLLGILFGSWVARIPAVQNQLGLNDGQLGIALLSLSVGAILAMPTTGWLIHRWGNVLVVRVAATLVCVALPLLPLAPTMPAFMVALFLFGICFGLLDVSMNTQAVAIETVYGRPIMSTLHGIFSIGGLTGAVTAGLAAGAGIEAFPHLLGIAVVLLVLSVIGGSFLPRVATREESAPPFAIPPRALLGLGLFSFCVLVGEGAVADWSAVYLENALGSSAAVAAGGYAAYSLAMAGMRLSGDALIERFGAATVVRAGCLLATIGMGGALLLGTIPAAVIGFACVGAGLAVGFPAALGAAGRTPGLASGAAIGAVATAGYAGLLLGPPLIGLISDTAGLRAGLGVVALLCFASAILAGAVKR